jgi:hypothetical protein
MLERGNDNRVDIKIIIFVEIIVSIVSSITALLLKVSTKLRVSVEIPTFSSSAII